MKHRTLSDPSYIELVASLRRARESRNLTQSELAGALDRPQSFVAKTERCERRLDIVDLIHICRVLRIQLKDVSPSMWKELL